MSNEKLIHKIKALNQFDIDLKGYDFTDDYKNRKDHVQPTVLLHEVIALLEQDGLTEEKVAVPEKNFGFVKINKNERYRICIGIFVDVGEENDRLINEVSVNEVIFDDLELAQETLTNDCTAANINVVYKNPIRSGMMLWESELSD